MTRENEIRNHGKISGKSPDTRKLNNTLLNNPWVKEEKGKLESVFEHNENENTTYQIGERRPQAGAERREYQEAQVVWIGIVSQGFLCQN